MSGNCSSVSLVPGLDRTPPPEARASSSMLATSAAWNSYRDLPASVGKNRCRVPRSPSFKRRLFDRERLTSMSTRSSDSSLSCMALFTSSDENEEEERQQRKSVLHQQMSQIFDTKKNVQQASRRLFPSFDENDLLDTFSSSTKTEHLFGTKKPVYRRFDEKSEMIQSTVHEACSGVVPNALGVRKRKKRTSHKFWTKNDLLTIVMDDSPSPKRKILKPSATSTQTERQLLNSNFRPINVTSSPEVCGLAYTDLKQQQDFPLNIDDGSGPTVFGHYHQSSPEMDQFDDSFDSSHISPIRGPEYEAEDSGVNKESNDNDLLFGDSSFSSSDEKDDEDSDETDNDSDEVFMEEDSGVAMSDN